MKDLRSISHKTQFCAIIGNPVSHSLSPAIHNAAFDHLGLDFLYVACEVTDVKSALAGMRALGNFRGMSVTIPHKIEAIKYVDEINPVDRSIGSINTVIHEGNRLIGIGTDGPGALKAFTDSGVTLDGKNVLILGAGGAARAISFTMANNTKLSQLTLLDINEALLSDLSADLKSGTKAPIHSAMMNDNTLSEAMDKADVIIHCTSVGMHPKEDNALVPAELFKPGQALLDIVYTPLETKILKNAQSKGTKVISGVEMFVNQAVLQFKQFTGEDAPINVMRNVVLEHLKK